MDKENLSCLHWWRNSIVTAIKIQSTTPKYHIFCLLWLMSDELSPFTLRLRWNWMKMLKILLYKHIFSASDCSSPPEEGASESSWSITVHLKGHCSPLVLLTFSLHHLALISPSWRLKRAWCIWIHHGTETALPISADWPCLIKTGCPQIDNKVGDLWLNGFTHSERVTDHQMIPKLIISSQTVVLCHPLLLSHHTNLRSSVVITYL